MWIFYQNFDFVMVSYFASRSLELRKWKSMPFRFNPSGVTPAAAGDLPASFPELGEDTQPDVADRATEPAADTTGDKYIHGLKGLSHEIDYKFDKSLQNLA
jgi:hypothetical protein